MQKERPNALLICIYLVYIYLPECRGYALNTVFIYILQFISFAQVQEVRPNALFICFWCFIFIFFPRCAGDTSQCSFYLIFVTCYFCPSVGRTPRCPFCLFLVFLVCFFFPKLFIFCDLFFPQVQGVQCYFISFFKCLFFAVTLGRHYGQESGINIQS